ncbi:uncharacterized protein LOC132330234 [Haemorhous mexicanus]|uniref:uncharacterized protein LOC132330234 n=1 Tax=Haemorhous mexicanus TaxID=30427 RepID=UPI0028BE5DFE|nr:uncharacterized protein LOC132330234 [Haemorhous mexicanus]
MAKTVSDPIEIQTWPQQSVGSHTNCASVLNSAPSGVRRSRPRRVRRGLSVPATATQPLPGSRRWARHGGRDWAPAGFQRLGWGGGAREAAVLSWAGSRCGAPGAAERGASGRRLRRSQRPRAPGCRSGLSELKAPRFQLHLRLRRRFWAVPMAGLATMGSATTSQGITAPGSRVRNGAPSSMPPWPLPRMRRPWICSSTTAGAAISGSGNSLRVCSRGTAAAPAPGECRGAGQGQGGQGHKVFPWQPALALLLPAGLLSSAIPSVCTWLTGD